MLMRNPTEYEMQTIFNYVFRDLLIFKIRYTTLRHSNQYGDIWPSYAQQPKFDSIEIVHEHIF